LPLLRDGGAVRWRTVLPGAARGHSTLLTDGHLGRGPLGGAPAYLRTPLAPPPGLPGEAAVGTLPGAPAADVPVTASGGRAGGRDGRGGWLRGGGGGGCGAGRGGGRGGGRGAG